MREAARRAFASAAFLLLVPSFAGLGVVEAQSFPFTFSGQPNLSARPALDVATNVSISIHNSGPTVWARVNGLAGGVPFETQTTAIASGTTLFRMTWRPIATGWTPVNFTVTYGDETRYSAWTITDVVAPTVAFDPPRLVAGESTRVTVNMTVPGGSHPPTGVRVRLCGLPLGPAESGAPQDRGACTGYESLATNPPHALWANASFSVKPESGGRLQLLVEGDYARGEIEVKAPVAVEIPVPPRVGQMAELKAIAGGSPAAGAVLVVVHVDSGDSTLLSANESGIALYSPRHTGAHRIDATLAGHASGRHFFESLPPVAQVHAARPAIQTGPLQRVSVTLTDDRGAPAAKAVATACGLPLRGSPSASAEGCVTSLPSDAAGNAAFVLSPVATGEIVLSAGSGRAPLGVWPASHDVEILHRPGFAGEELRLRVRDAFGGPAEGASVRAVADVSGAEVSGVVGADGLVAITLRMGEWSIHVGVDGEATSGLIRAVVAPAPGTVSISGLSVPRSASGPFDVGVVVRNAGKVVERVWPELWIDNVFHERQEVQVPPSAERRVAFLVRLDTPGEYDIDVRIPGVVLPSAWIVVERAHTGAPADPEAPPSFESPDLVDPAPKPSPDLGADEPPSNPNPVVGSSRPTAADLVGAAVVLLARRDDSLLPIATALPQADGTLDVPALAETPAAALVLKNGHGILRDIDGVPIADILRDAPAAAIGPDALGLSGEMLSRFAGSIAGVRVEPIGAMRAGEPREVLLRNFSGLVSARLTPSADAAGAQLIVARIVDEGPPGIPLPRAEPRVWFALTLATREGALIPVEAAELTLTSIELPRGRELVLAHHRLGDEGWEILPTETVDAGALARVEGFSIFAIATRDSGAAGALAAAVEGGPWLPWVGGGLALLLVGALLLGGRPLRERLAGRAPARATVAIERPVARTEARELVVSGLAVEISGKAILHDVSFSLARGEIVAVLGPSGAGKSTLLKAMVGEAAYAGDIDIFGLSPRRDAAALRAAIGYVAQDAELYAEMTVKENVVYFARQYGLDGEELAARTNRILHALGLDENADQVVRLLSGGQRRRAALAASLVHLPALVILDEPTSGLDPTTRRNLWRFLQGAARELDVSIIVTTHFLEEALLGDGVVILSHGRVAAHGSPDDLLRSVPGGGPIVAALLKEVPDEKSAALDAALATLAAEGLAEKLEREGLQLRIFTSDPGRTTRRLLDVLAGLEMDARRLVTEEATMHDVFAHFANEPFVEGASA